MGTAGAEGFGPAISGAKTEDACNNGDVGSNNGQHWDKDVHCTQKQNQYFIDIGIGTYKF